jgi:hypothetical protein
MQNLQICCKADCFARIRVLVRDLLILDAARVQQRFVWSIPALLATHWKCLLGKDNNMSFRSLRNLGLGAIASMAILAYSDSASAQYGYTTTGHHHHRPSNCAPRQSLGYGYYPTYRPIVVYPSYGGVYSGYSSGYRGLNTLPTWGGYGMGAFPPGGSYGGGAFPLGGSYGGGTGFSLYIGR